MLGTWVPPVVALAYVVLLFLVAWSGDRLHRRGVYVPTPVVYSLALGVYCTSWTFFGAVGRAASQGWDYLSIYLGPIIVFLMMTRLPARIVKVSKQQSITSVADFIATRYGKVQGIAALASIMALVTVLPYIALQLKAIAGSYSLIMGGEGMGVMPAVSRDTGLVAAALLAVFTILFGTRQVDSTESHRGMVLAVAFESAVKLVAFTAVGLWVMYGLFDSPGALITASQANAVVTSLYSTATIDHSFLVLTVISMLAILCLPRQFHVAVVENSSPRDLRLARWLFPAYLAVFTVFVVPIAAAGLVTQGGGNADGFLISLPLAQGQDGLALLAFLGGFSAATGMVIVGTIACSTMLCNEVVMPALVKLRGEEVSSRTDLASLLILIRRVLIVAILALGWLAYRVIGTYGTLASIGLLSFALAAQFGPAMIGGLYWRRATRAGAMTGMVVGFALWTWTLLVPAFAQTGWLPMSLVEAGPWGVGWLRPYAMFGMDGFDPVTHGVLWSLGANLACFIAVSWLSAPRMLERRQAAAFVGDEGERLEGGMLPSFTQRMRGAANVGDLRILAERFIGREKAAAAFAGHFKARGLYYADGARADVQLLELTERLLSGAMGASAARMVLVSALRGVELQIEDVASIVGEASQVSRFNRDLLESTLENVAEGISVLDADNRLVVWNRRYAELFRYPDRLLRIGTPVEDLIRYNAELGRCGPGDAEEHVAKRLAHLQQGKPHIYQRVRDDGLVLEMRVNPLPGGGYVASFSDITEHKRTERALRESERNIRVYTDNVPVLIAYVDRNLVYRFVNKAYEQAVGLHRDAICGRRVNEVLGRESFLQREAHMEGALAGIRQNFEVAIRDEQGRTRYAEATYIPEFDTVGAIQGFYAMFHDITERRRAQQDLREAYGTLEQRVEERTRELSDLNQRLRNEIELRNRIERALREAKGDAETANLSKTRFLAAASHDLLQPLNAARLFTSALAQGEHDGKTMSAVERIDSSLRAAEELLGALLDISKLDAGALEPQLSHFRVDDVLATLSVEFGIIARERNIAFRTAPSSVIVHTDRQFLRRILQNFLSNALRYTRQGKVLLGCRWRGDMLSIQVLDTGPGIAAEHLESDIFEEFRRFQPRDELGAKGMGLGLAIVQRMARALGHQVRVRSELGRGSVFSVDVPISTAPVLPARKPAEPLPAARLDEAVVLCIDNEQSILEGMTHLLEGWSCSVLTATNTGAALAALEQDGRVPDLLLVDFHLDGDDTGLRSIAEVRARWGNIPSVVITADYGEDMRERVRAAGFAIMRKPVKPAALRAMMSQLLLARRRLAAAG
ncbi:hybrid sensor histidine kinase/response regulator [Thioalkalivibrio sp. XN8]|uniref:hybrid sensor histidine kinase/response regulator n=1 Tax=Thioalkalivibrio sp. XN8 TaxID=2712863 RepID=UPI0013ED7099|nr:hybrid sensor histidine kinase/response regulator [Thioalkalivibrio sp. XN8]NGP52628.1 hybrid sensor histidine kinase/response regulator [Thioalkalivibrio sp. XN8]